MNLQTIWDLIKQIKDEGLPNSGGGGGASATDIGNATNTALKSSPQPIKSNRLNYAFATQTNAASVVTINNAPPGQRHVIEQIIFSHSGGVLPTAGVSLTLVGATTISFDVTATGLAPVELAFPGATAGGITATLAAGGVGIIGKLVVAYRTEAV